MGPRAKIFGGVCPAELSRWEDRGLGSDVKSPGLMPGDSWAEESPTIGRWIRACSIKSSREPDPRSASVDDTEAINNGRQGNQMIYGKLGVVRVTVRRRNANGFWTTG